MKALVIGGAGFIGSHLVERLVREGHSVRAFDNLTTGKRENLAPFAADVELVVADVRHAERLRQEMRGCEVVFHQAAIVSVPYSIEHPRRDARRGTPRDAERPRRGAKQAAWRASSWRHRRRCTARIRSSRSARRCSWPRSPRTASRSSSRASTTSRCVDEALRRRDGGASLLQRLRPAPGSVVGVYSGVISILVDRILAGKPITIFGDGEQFRDFVYVANVVEANFLAATRPRGVGDGVYNVGCVGKRTKA